MRHHLALLALVLVVTLAHAPFLPSSLDDIDSVNFALGVRRFDVADHRPHPPGYPVYVAIGRVAVAAAGHLTSPGSRSAVEARGLSAVALACAAVSVLLLYGVFTCLSKPDTDRVQPPWRTLDLRALAAVTLTIACPLFWYMSARPMSDMPGLAAALAAQACLALAWWRQRPAPDGDRRLTPAATAASGRMIVLGALLLGLAVGVRSQALWLTAPLLLVVLVDRIGRGVAGALIGSTAAFAIGVLLWAVPLVVVSGGPGAYLGALGGQAGEDFAGVEMLYLYPSARLAAHVAARTFAYPWDSWWLAGVVLALAAIGAGRLLVTDRRTASLLGAMTLPYLVFHGLFHDTTFTRYALPFVPVVAFLAATGIEAAGRRALVAGAVALSAWSLGLAVPAAVAFAARPSPTVRALEAMRADRSADRPGALALHQAFRRPLEAEVVPVGPQLPAPPQHEWLEIARYWRQGRADPLWMLADPQRTDLALFDPESRRDAVRFSRDITNLSGLGGMRPADAIWYRLSPPGWFAEEGWALTPETAGMAHVMGRGPHLGPITAWVRRRPQPVRVMVGGRHLGASSDPDVTVRVTVDGRNVAAWRVAAGFFAQWIDLPAGALDGDGPLARLQIQAVASGDTIVPTEIQQFDVQSVDRFMWAYGDGWHEAEYSPDMGVWRWASPRAEIETRGARGGLTLRLRVDSPLRYFDEPASVRVMAGDRELARLMAGDEPLSPIVIPVDALARSVGRITIETDRHFVPAEAGGPPDRRALSLRVFVVDLAPAAAGLR